MLPLKYYSVLCFSVMSDSMIMDAIASFLVLPNRLVVPLVPGLPVAQLRSPLPRVRPDYSSAHSDYNCTSSFKTLVYEPLLLSQGVVRIHLLEAQKLVAKDNYVKGVMAGLSDPYAILRVGPQTFTSKHIDNTDAPKWGEMYEVRRKVFCFLCEPSARKLENVVFHTSFHFVLYLSVSPDISVTGIVHFHSRGCRQLPYKPLCQSSCPYLCSVHQVIVHEVPGQELEVEVYDKDPDKDDFLGRYICIIHVLVESHVVTFHLSPA